jgi:hypothetical protein
MRDPDEIRAEIDELSARRTEAWQRLSAGDRSVRDEIGQLTQRVDELWVELRETSLLRRFGPRDWIIERARVEERFEREQRRSRARAEALGGGNVR